MSAACGYGAAVYGGRWSAPWEERASTAGCDLLFQACCFLMHESAQKKKKA